MNRRNTPAKQAILNILKTSKKALSFDDIEKLINIDINKVTIYRVLNRFFEDKVIHKIVASDGKQYFAFHHNKKHSHDHFHFKCENCNTIECLDMPIEFNAPKGYEIYKTNCILIGVCNDCS